MRDDFGPNSDYDALETEIAFQFDQLRNKITRPKIRKNLEQKGYKPEEVKYIMRQLDVYEDQRLARGRKIMQGVTISITALGLLGAGLFFLLVKPLFPTVIETLENGIIYESTGFWALAPYIMLFFGLVMGIRAFIIIKEVREGDNRLDATAGEAPKYF